MFSTKKCIWCSKSESSTITFNKLAHTVPQSLGGTFVCSNVCDNCNHYFGSYHHGLPPIETVIKEAFILARYRMLNGKNIGKNQAMARFKSTFFNVSPKTNGLSLKPKFLLTPHFQENLGRQLKRGVYKMYLEEVERQFGDGHNPKYDFIREFARYNLNDCPLYYFLRKHGIIMMSQEWIKRPSLLLGDHKPMNYLVKVPGFDEVEFLGHVMGLATSRLHESLFDQYMEKSSDEKKEVFRAWREVKYFTDIDVAMSIFNSKVS